MSAQHIAKGRFHVGKVQQWCSIIVQSSVGQEWGKRWAASGCLILQCSSVSGIYSVLI